MEMVASHSSPSSCLYEAFLGFNEMDFDLHVYVEYKDCAQDCERQVANIRLEM